MRRFLPLGVFVILAVLCGLALMRGKAPVSALIGKSAPAGVEGPVVVNFFASWCVPCAAEQPVLEKIKARGVVVQGVAWKDKEDDVARWLEKYGNPYKTVTQDADGRRGVEWGVTGVPETFIVDGAGIVRYKSAGPVTDDMVDEIVALAEGK